jgi:hypothetical protein
MKQKVSFAMRVRHHRAIHGVEADAAERAMEHGHSFNPPVGIFLLFTRTILDCLEKVTKGAESRFVAHEPALQGKKGPQKADHGYRRVGNLRV